MDKFDITRVFFIISFDKLSDIRGTFDGSVNQITELMIKFLDKKNINRVILIGHSMGGSIVETFSKNYPNRTIGVC